MKEFEGRVAVVTGGASGMGRAFAERFAREGMKVVLADIEEEALEAAVTEMRRAEHQVIGVHTDVARPESVDELARKTLEAYGKVHVVCNNAGVVADSELAGLRVESGFTPVWGHSLNDWRWVFNVNLFGVVHGIRTFLPIMLAQDEEGHVVNTASVAGLTSGPTLPIYGATKHAVVRISEALHVQLAQIGAKVKASVLCPGGVRTRITAASRNRPAELADDVRPTVDDLLRRDERWSERIGPTGLEPEAVAEMVLDAVREERFYILTHDQFDGAIRQRMESILARRNPELPRF
jgi:NAD(P)-dependent dehydrogenase (short-subunit alcohol dehydrogenase family)